LVRNTHARRSRALIFISAFHGDRETAMSRTSKIGAALGLALLLAPAIALPQGPDTGERVAALRQSLQKSAEALTHYEWIETTAVSLKGEEKTRLQKRCYHGADGTLQKVPVGEAPQGKKKRGIRGKVVEKKKGELTEYMQRAVDLVQDYVPPDPQRIQQAKDAGKVAVNVLEPGKRVRLGFSDYKKPGDTLGVEMDLTDNRLLGLTVASYLDSPDDAVGLKVGFSTLADGSSYASDVALDAPAKSLSVQMQNSGYKKIR
jgi:hypothetical protein